MTVADLAFYAFSTVTVAAALMVTLSRNPVHSVLWLILTFLSLRIPYNAARLVKKSVVGTGKAEKEQVQAMLRILLPGLKLAGPDAADALAVAITHAHHCRG